MFNHVCSHLTKAIKPAGMNFQELKNLSPITTARVPEVPAIFHSGGGRDGQSCVCERCTATVTVQQTKLAHRARARHSWDFEMPDKRRLQPTGRTGARPPERWRCLWRKHNRSFYFEIKCCVKFDGASLYINKLLVGGLWRCWKNLC